MNKDELVTKLNLELVTYEDGMVSTKDYIEQTIKLCEAYKKNDGWNKIEDDGYPEKGRRVDAYTYTREGVRTVQELSFDGENEYGIHWLGEGDCPYPVTHYRDRPDPPREE